MTIEGDGEFVVGQDTGLIQVSLAKASLIVAKYAADERVHEV